MESKPTAAELSAALTDAEASRAALAGRIVTPSWLFTSLGAAVAIQIATMAVGWGTGAVWVVISGLVPFVAVAAVQLARFRRLNGVWLGGFASRVVLGCGVPASVSYVAGLVGALWAAFDDRWWLVALWSLAGGAGYAFSGRRWMQDYRGDPERHGRGESVAWLVAIALAAVTCLALLLINS
jgi:hypothetical protein